MAEGIAESAHPEEKEGDHHNPKISDAEGYPSQMDTSLASIYLEEMRSDHSHHDDQSCNHDEDQNGLYQVKSPTLHGFEDILGKSIDRYSSGIEVIGIHGDTFHVDISISLDRIGRSSQCLRSLVHLVPLGT